MAIVLLSGASLSFAQQSPALPPGITLPTKGTMYAVDTTGTQTNLVQLHANEIVSNSHAGSNFLRSMVYANLHASVELKGINADTHLQSSGLSFLTRLSDEETELMRKRLTLIRLKQTADRRVVSAYSQNVFGGQRGRQYDVVETTKTDVPDSDWVKLTPVKPLEPGEYGLVIMPKDASLFTDVVYDFDVDFREGKAETK